MTSLVLELRAGTGVWLDGARWEVVGFFGSDVIVRSGVRLLRIRMAELAGHSSTFGATSADFPQELDVVVLSQLNSRQRQAVAARSRVVTGVLEAVQQGTRPLGEAVTAASVEAHVSERTIERWLSAYRAAGVTGLVDARVRGGSGVGSRVDPRWDAACRQALARYVDASTPTRGAVIAEIAYALEAEYGPDTVPLPSRSAAYSRLAELSKGRHAFGSAKSRRSVANRPKGPFGRLRAMRPGEYVVLDTTPLDVFAMEPVTLRWVDVELTVAMDLYSRCVLGLRLTPVSTKSADVANVLYQCVAPGVSAAAPGDWPFHGVPQVLLVGHEQPRAVLPSVVPEAIVVDRGRQYLSSHVVSACSRMGITIQPAIPNKPTDKPTVERFFRTLRESLLQHLPAYKGPDVYSRGKNVEDQAFLYVGELEQIIRDWVGATYHNSKHDGLCVPELPGLSLSPSEMFEAGMAKAGGLRLLSDVNIAYEFLDVRWRTIQHYGVEFDGRRYDGAALNLYRNVRSPYRGVHSGQWPIFVDVHDVRRAYFRDPQSKQWHTLDWEHAAALDQPFSDDAARYVKRIVMREGRHVDPGQAVRELLTQWSRNEVETRRDRSLARRLSVERASSMVTDSGSTKDQDGSVPPDVIDLVQRRQMKGSPIEVVDDVDVFAQYYAENPDADGLEVFDE